MVVGSLVLAASGQAEGFERQWHAGVGAGLAGVTWNDEVRSGLGGGLHLAYGLTDSYNLMIELGASTHDLATDPAVESSPLLVSHGAVGAAYTLDIISWVPYMGLLVGGYRFTGAELEEAEHRLGFQGALGMDYRPSRDWAVGLQLRYHTFSEEPLQTHYMTSFARFELLWGW